MTDKEKEAIDNFNFFYEGDYVTREVEESKNIVLNLIQTQQEEIFKLQAKADRLKTNNEILQGEFERLEDLEDNTEMLKLELQKANKVIDEMANYIVLSDTSEICKNVENKNCDEEKLGRCIDCVKEYFAVEKESKDENN